MPALGFSLFLTALGAILAFAVEWTASGIDIGSVGMILMVVGIVGIVLSLLFWTSFAPFGNRSSSTTTTTYDDDVHTHRV